LISRLTPSEPAFVTPVVISARISGPPGGYGAGQALHLRQATGVGRFVELHQQAADRGAGGPGAVQREQVHQVLFHGPGREDRLTDLLRQTSEIVDHRVQLPGVHPGRGVQRAGAGLADA
jgi:hypothetical protein